jgi:hypothetical protein
MSFRLACRHLVRFAVPLVLLAAAACAAPQGVIEGAFHVSSAPGHVRVVGWALDPDLAAPIQVHVYVSGRMAGMGTAGLARPDLARNGVVPSVGYDLTVQASDGNHQVCVYGIDDASGPSTLLGCRDIRVGVAIGPVDPRYQASLLTSSPDRRDILAITVSGASTIVSAAAGNQDGNIRVVFVDATAPVIADQLTCATWSDQTGHQNQQGVALRVSNDGPTRAITVTKNVWGGVSDVFNVHLWDSSQPTGGIRLLGSESLGPALHVDGRLAPLPWRMCAKVVGSVVSFKVWPANQSEPEWGNPTFSRSTQLPAGAPAAGRPGWYGAHLYEGAHITYTDMSSGPA